MTDQTFVTLPLELWQGISEFINKSDQIHWRRTNSVFRDFKPTKELCCAPPSNKEIAIYLTSQRFIDSMNKRNLDTFYVLNKNHSELVFSKNRIIGIFSDGMVEILHNWQDVVFLMQGTTLDMDSVNSWIVIRDVYHGRIGCKKGNIDPDECYILFLVKHLPETNRSVTLLSVIVIFEVFNMLNKEFLNDFPGETIFAISPIENERRKQVEWLRSKLEKLKPEDLKSVW